MKVDFKHGTLTKGIFSKTTYYTVEVSFQLTEEEKAIIKERKLQDRIIMEMPAPAHCRDDKSDFDLDVTLRYLIEGSYKTNFHTPSEAKEFQAKLIERLKVAKEFLDNNAKPLEDTSIEI